MLTRWGKQSTLPEERRAIRLQLMAEIVKSNYAPMSMDWRPSGAGNEFPHCPYQSISPGDQNLSTPDRCLNEAGRSAFEMQPFR